MGRDPKHDYKSRCIYHITIAKAPGCPAFSRVTGTPEHPLVERSVIGENGGVLVSPFISRDEKVVRQQCEEAGGKIILLSNKPFGEREKPSARDFDLCTRGRLLILSPMATLEAGREAFLFLNSVAESIAGLRH